jgi:prepilin-type N-terminal cleavage/methylation domain-containing protein
MTKYPMTKECRISNDESGFTLLEMLLVLAVLTVALAILYPATERLYQTHRFTQALEQMRGKMAAARVRAIDDGVIYQFRYEPQGRRVLVIPYAEERTASSNDANAAASTATRESRWRFFGELPRGMKFQAADISTERISRQQLDDFADPGQLANAAWSTPIFFFPDGSANDAAIRVTDSDGRSMLLSVRGLTGAASTSSIQREGMR